jgi:hypothetical protein
MTLKFAQKPLILTYNRGLLTNPLGMEDGSKDLEASPK